jgi:hypothetical protein
MTYEEYLSQNNSFGNKTFDLLKGEKKRREYMQNEVKRLDELIEKAELEDKKEKEAEKSENKEKK